MCYSCAMHSETPTYTPEQLARLAAQFLANQRRQQSKACAWCGQEFTGIKTRLYCDRRCCDAAWRAAHPRVRLDESWSR